MGNFSEDLIKYVFEFKKLQYNLYKKTEIKITTDTGNTFIEIYSNEMGLIFCEY